MNIRTFFLPLSNKLNFSGIVLILGLSTLINTQILTFNHPWFATIAGLISALVLPGFFLTGLVYNKSKMSWPEMLPMAFVMGLGLLSLPAILLLMLNVRLDSVVAASTAVNIIMGGLYIWVKRSSDANHMTTHDLAILRSFHLPLLIATIIAAIATTVLYISTASTWSFGDNWSYLLYIRHYLDQPLGTTVSALPEWIGGSIRGNFNGWWVLQALLFQVIGFDLVETYSFYLPPILIVISLLAFYNLAKILLDSKNAALLAVLLQILFYFSSVGSHDWIGRGFFDRIIEDKFLIWLIILPVFAQLIVRYFGTGQWQHLLLIWICIVALAFTHPIGLIQGAIALTAFGMTHLLFNPQKEKLVRFGAILAPVLIFLIIPLIQRQLMATQVTAGASFNYAQSGSGQFILSQTRLWVFSAKDNLYMAHPQLVAHPLTILAILLTPLLIPYLRRSIAAQFLFSNMALPLLILYNPLTAPLLGRLVTPWMLWRIPWLLPVSLTIGFFLYKIAVWIEQALPKQSWRQVTPVLLVVVLALPLTGYIREGLQLLRDRHARTMTAAERDLLLHVRDQVAPGEVVLAESTINTTIPAFSSAARVLDFRWGGEAIAKADIARFYQAGLVTQSTLDILQRHQARYVIIPRDHGLTWQFKGLPAHFELLYQNEAYAFYEVGQLTQPDEIVTGNTYFIQGDWPAARAAYERVLADDPAKALAYFGRGQVYQATGQAELAEAAFQQAIAHQADNAPARLALAGLYESQNRSAEALAQYQAAIAQQPGYPAAHEKLGDFFLRQRNEAAAKEHYRQAIPFSPNLADYYLALGDIYRSRGLLEEAIAAYRQALDRDQYSEVARAAAAWRLALTYQIEDKPAEAVSAFQQTIMIQVPPVEQLGYEDLGRLYLSQEQPAKAIDLFQQAGRVHQNEAWPHLALGKIYLTQAAE